jgi:photosystem II core protein PsbZ
MVPVAVKGPTFMAGFTVCLIRPRASPYMQILNTLTVLALVVLSFALIVAVPMLYASTEDRGRSNRLILLGEPHEWA